VKALDYALALERRGLSIIPVEPGGKLPLVEWKQFQTRRATPDELRQAFAEERNIGVVTGSVSRIVIVDADSTEAEAWALRELPRTPWRVRTARGLHLYYQHPGIPVRNKARLTTKNGALALDVRGDGGFVVGPGSVHASGAAYRPEGDWSVPVADLPVFDVRLLAPPPRPEANLAHGQDFGRPTGDLVTRARAYLASIPPPIIGQGSDAATLYAACRLARGFELPEAEAASLLWDWCGNRPGWSREWVETKVRHAVQYGSEPVGGLR
jgi:hypothetical protein